MRFQSKIVLGYTILMLAITLIFGIAFYQYSNQQYRHIEENSLKSEADQLLGAMEDQIVQMETAVNYILSSPDILEGMTMLSRADEGLVTRYLDQSRDAITAGITTDYLTNYFYRTLVYNRDNEVFSANSVEAKRIYSAIPEQQMQYMELADQSPGRTFIISAHEDPWGISESVQVFSLLKAVRGDNMGYIEIQKTIEDLKHFSLLGEKRTYVLFVNGEDVLASTADIQDKTQYEQFLKMPESQVMEVNLDGMGDQLAVTSYSSEYRLTALVLEDTENMEKNGIKNGLVILVLCVLFFGVSLFFVIMISKYLTKPIRQMKKVIDNTQLENLDEGFSITATNNEIEALSNAYEKLMKRMQEAIVKEKRASILQLQAQFDSLQAQINPHFLYNVLNILSARGLDVGDEQICEICGSLATMLRYSTNNINRYASVQEELDYLNQYLYLLQVRYESKISFEVQVDESVLKETLPKIVLQQIVENSVNHGFHNSTDTMVIKIHGWRDSKGWYIQIRDNGEGFEKDAIQKLIEKMEAVKKKIYLSRDNVEIEIGGMGLVNTCARCLLMYNDLLVFQMENWERGASVTLGALKEK